MVSMQTEERIGEAWRQHRMGNNPEAITIFREILSKRPDHLDAIYGLGLAQRTSGDVAGARESFNRALELTEEALMAKDRTSIIEGLASPQDLDSYQDDRFMMLQRMIGQRLEELDAIEV